MFTPLNPPVRDWHGQRVWLIGASSGIGAALAQKLLLLGARVAVSARREAALKEVVHDYPNALILPFDASAADDWLPAWQKLQAQWNGVDLVLFCAADYQPQRSWEVSGDDAARTIAINLTAVYRGLELVLPALITQGSGGVGVIASVAGFLGLPQATVYGPSKAALINLAEILYADLHPKGLAVYLINPGFVATRLTEKNAFAMPALQTPQSAAEAIVHGIEAGRFEIHFPRRFTFFLKCLRLLPYRLQFAITQNWFGGMMKPLEKLVHWYENLSPETLDEITDIYASEACFRDPFNDVHGVAAIRAIFAHMFATTETPAFVVTERFERGTRAVLLWRFTFGLHGRLYEIEGASHLLFNEAGLVVEHRDYWDSSEELLQKLPVIGALLRWLKKRFAASD